MIGTPPLELQNSFMTSMYETLTVYCISLFKVGSTSAAAECFNATPETLSAAERVQLCKGAESKDPAKCVSTLLPISSKRTGANMSVVHSVTPFLLFENNTTHCSH